MIRFTVIIPTLERVKEPLLMLESLKKQTFKNFEVIIIDQNENGIIEKEINSYKKYYQLTHIKVEPLGASNARNVGLEKASGEIITFPDDDCEYPCDFLHQINSYFIENIVDGIVASTEDKEDGKSIAMLATKPKRVNRNNILSTVIEAGIFVKKEKIKGIKFDTHLGVGSKSSYWSDEGPDFILRLLEKGCNINYCPQFKMFHPNPVKIYNKKTTKRSFRYGKGRGYFLKKNNYGLGFILYYLLLYFIGMCKAIVFLNLHMFNYFKKGFQGRFEGYFLSR